MTEIQKTIDSNTFSYNLIQKAIDGLKELLSNVNKEKKRVKARRSKEELKAQLGERHSNVMQEAGEYVRGSGHQIIIYPISMDQKASIPKGTLPLIEYRGVFLFEKTLLLIRPKEDGQRSRNSINYSFEVLDISAANAISIQDVDLASFNGEQELWLRNSIRILARHTTDAHYITVDIGFESAVEKHDWLKEMNSSGVWSYCIESTPSGDSNDITLLSPRRNRALTNTSVYSASSNSDMEEEGNSGERRRVDECFKGVYTIGQTNIQQIGFNSDAGNTTNKRSSYHKYNSRSRSSSTASNTNNGVIEFDGERNESNAIISRKPPSESNLSSFIASITGRKQKNKQNLEDIHSIDSLAQTVTATPSISNVDDDNPEQVMKQDDGDDSHKKPLPPLPPKEDIDQTNENGIKHSTSAITAINSHHRPGRQLKKSNSTGDNGSSPPLSNYTKPHRPIE